MKKTNDLPEVNKEKAKKENTTKNEFYQAIGRRREACARVRLYVVKKESIDINGKIYKAGEIIVNGRSVENYFPGAVYRKHYLEPFVTVNSINRFVTTAVISGGGLSGQLQAFMHGVSRAIESIDKEKYRALLKRKGFLSRDQRAKERRKAGYAQKARSRKQSPKR